MSVRIRGVSCLLGGMRTSAVIGVAVASLSLSCTKSESSTVRTPVGSPTKTVERDKTVASAVGGSIRVDGMSVVGNVRWKPACRIKNTQPFEERQVTTVRSDDGANVAWIATGALLLGGMGYALKARETASSAQTNCTTDDQGKTSCISDREKLGNIAGVAGVAGGAVLLWGIGGLVRPTKTEEGNPYPVSSDHIDPTNIPCGKTEDLAGLQLVLRAPGLQSITATADTQGNIRFALPDLSEYDASARAAVFIGEVPPALAKFVAPNTLATEISLAPYATLAERRAEQDAAARAARAAADQQEFTSASTAIWLPETRSRSNARPRAEMSATTPSTTTATGSTTSDAATRAERCSGRSHGRHRTTWTFT